MNFKYIFGFYFIFVCTNAFAGNIAYGTLMGVQVHDSAQGKITRIYFHGNDGDIEYDETTDCKGSIPYGEKYVFANITHNQHDIAALQQMTSVALAAYMSGKKVRAYSYTNNSCEVDMLSIQSAYF